jgi:aryl-alcohol dehydrogenase-like predicted oxidoreductase
MEYTVLGTSTLKVSRVCFGSMSLPADELDSDFLINTAIDQGINFFDTADLYEKGENESRLGKILLGKRDQVILATKVGNQWRADGSGWDWNPSKSYILKAVDESLKRLRTDYIDLYQLHGGTIEDPLEETIEAFEILQSQGKIREYGISSIRPNVIREYITKSKIVSVMTQYSLLDRRPEESTVQLLNNHKISILARGGLAQGLLAGKAPKAYLDRTESEVSAVQQLVKEISISKSQAQTALLFLLQKNPNLIAVTGIRTKEQLADVSKVFDVSKLAADEIEKLNLSLSANLYKDHR